MTRIIIADDHGIVRQGVKMIVKQTDAQTQIDEVENGNQLLERVRYSSYDLAIVDITMPGRDIFDILQEIKILQPELKVIILTMNAEEEYAERAFNLGISGFVSKEQPPEELEKAIRNVRNGNIYISHYLTNYLLSKGTNKKKPDILHHRLTTREFQVFRLLADGDSVSDIANRLSISPNTISNHRLNILKKLSLKNNTELTKYAIKYNII